MNSDDLTAAAEDSDEDDAERLAHSSAAHANLTSLVAAEPSPMVVDQDGAVDASEPVCMVPQAIAAACGPLSDAPAAARYSTTAQSSSGGTAVCFARDSSAGSEMGAGAHDQSSAVDGDAEADAEAEDEICGDDEGGFDAAVADDPPTEAGAAAAAAASDSVPGTLPAWLARFFTSPKSRAAHGHFLESMLARFPEVSGIQRLQSACATVADWL